MGSSVSRARKSWSRSLSFKDFTLGRKESPFDLLFPNSSLLEFQQGTRFREQKHSRTRRKLSILLRFYFHGVLEQLKTNFQTNFRFKRVLGFVIEYA